MKTVEGFRHFKTHHCVTGSMRHLFAWAGHDCSEELLLGLGEGVGFAYFHFRGQLPFLGGRAQPKPSMEEIACRRLGVGVAAKCPSSDRAAEASLAAELDSGRPAMIQVDMGFLPYFDFHGTDYHFGGHVVVACGRGEETGEYLVADREGELHTVPAAALVAARSSRCRPFPPSRRWWRFDFSAFHDPSREDLLAALRRQCAFMLEPPIANLGVAGIGKAAGEVGRWAELLPPAELSATLLNLYIFASATGGSGGGLFRYMFSRFIAEAAERGGGAEGAALARIAPEFGAAGDAWEEAGALCRTATEGSGMSPDAAVGALPELARRLLAIARLEDAAWRHLSAALPGRAAARP